MTNFVAMFVILMASGLFSLPSFAGKFCNHSKMTIVNHSDHDWTVGYIKLQQETECADCNEVVEISELQHVWQGKIISAHSSLVVDVVGKHSHAYGYLVLHERDNAFALHYDFRDKYDTLFSFDGVCIADASVKKQYGDKTIIVASDAINGTPALVTFEIDA